MGLVQRDRKKKKERKKHIGQIELKFHLQRDWTQYQVSSGVSERMEHINNIGSLFFYTAGCHHDEPQRE